MHTLLLLGLCNLVMALLLGLVAALVGRCCRQPALTHALWLLVLLKLVTPPLVMLPLPWAAETPPTSAAPPPLVVLTQEVPAPIQKEQPPPDPVPEPLEVPLDLPEFLPGAGPVQELLPAKEEIPGPILVQEPVAPAGSDPVVEAEPVTEEATLFLPVLVGGLWLVGSVLWWSLALVRIGRFQRLLRHTQPAPAEFQAEATDLAQRMGRRDCPEVRLAPGLLAPMLWSMGRTTCLLMPAALLARLDADQRQTLLAHELAHWRRRDHWVRYLELFVFALYWWLPLAWWARRELREAEEECCDAWVVWLLPQAARAYATALVETLDFLATARPSLPPAASAMGQFNLLRRRVTMIMRGTTPRALTMVGVLAVGSLALLLLPVVPGFAQRVAVEDPDPQQPPIKGKIKLGDLDKARADLEKIAIDLQHMQKQLDAQQMALAKKKKDLDEAAQRLLYAEQIAQAQKAFQEKAKPPMGPNNFGPGPGGMMPVPMGGNLGGWMKGGGDVEKRLGDVEKKLDLLLRELLDLRSELKKGRGGFGGGGGPGGGGFGGGGFGGQKSGGFGAPVPPVPPKTSIQPPNPKGPMGTPPGPTGVVAPVADPLAQPPQDPALAPLPK